MSGYDALLILLGAFGGLGFLFFAVRGWRIGEISAPVDRMMAGPFRRHEQRGRFWLTVLLSMALAALCFWVTWKFWEQLI